MPITIAELTAEDVATIKSQSAAIVEDLSEKELNAALVALFWAVAGDGGAIDTVQLKANAAALCKQMDEREMKAALVFTLWSSGATA